MDHPIPDEYFRERLVAVPHQFVRRRAGRPRTSGDLLRRRQRAGCRMVRWERQQLDYPGLDEPRLRGFLVVPLNVSTGGQDVRPRYQVTCSADGTKLTSVWSHYDGSDFFIQASTAPPITPTATGMFYVIPNRKGGGAVIYLQ